MDDSSATTRDTDVTVPPATDARSANGLGGTTNATGLTGVTDLHRTKVPADDPRLKIELPKSRTLRRGPALAAAVILSAVIATVVVVALTPSSTPADDAKKGDDTEGTAANNVTLPDVLRDSPEPREGVAARSTAAEQRTLTNAAGAPLPTDSSNAAGQRADSVRQARFEESSRARGASVFAALDDTPASETPAARPSSPGATDTAADPTRAAAGPSDPSRGADPNMQDRKNDFLARAGVNSAEYLDKALSLPRSPYELKAGTVIPTVLITGINSDLPGQVVGQVRENVYDTVSGNYLLIPQGSRVIAAYDSMVAWGQERVLVCWNRLIRPDGTSITLDCMPGVDLAGYAGFTDDVDNHWWRIISGAAFSSLLAATAQRSQGDVTTYQPSLSQTWAGNAAGQVNQAGQQITARNLQMQPTITVRPGFSVNVLVSKDIVIPPYHMQGVSP